MNDEQAEREAQPPQWQPVTAHRSCDDFLARIRVPGGWLYRSTQLRTGHTSESMCFVPAPRLLSDMEPR